MVSEALVWRPVDGEQTHLHRLAQHPALDGLGDVVEALAVGLDADDVLVLLHARHRRFGVRSAGLVRARQGAAQGLALGLQLGFRRLV
jgi:hypothetical protein